MAKRKKEEKTPMKPDRPDETDIVSSALGLAIDEEIGFAVRPLRQFVPQIIAGNPPTMDEVKKVMSSIKYGDETLLDVLGGLIKGRGNLALK